MRENKYRAWNTDTNEWHYFDMNIGYREFDRSSEILDIIVCWQQYTGLKDKYGQEIYEGDIVKYILPDFGIEVIGKIAYSSGCFTAHIITSGGVKLTSLNNFLWSCINIEIIGNTQQNPELLKGDINELDR